MVGTTPPASSRERAGWVIPARLASSVWDSPRARRRSRTAWPIRNERAACAQRVQAAFGAPGQVAAQIGLGVVAGGTLEPGQVGSHCQPQLISERDQVIRWARRQAGEVRHAQTLRLLPAPANAPGAAEQSPSRADHHQSMLVPPKGGED